MQLQSPVHMRMSHALTHFACTRAAEMPADVLCADSLVAKFNLVCADAWKVQFTNSVGHKHKQHICMGWPVPACAFRQ